MSKLREEEEKKKKSAQAREILETIGEEGKRGRKAAKEYFDESVGREREERALESQMLEDSRRTLETYHGLIAKLLLKRLHFVDFPEGWSAKVAPTKEGVLMELYSPDGGIFRAGFKPVGLARYDLNAVDVYAVRAENTIDRVTGADRANGEIIVP